MSRLQTAFRVAAKDLGLDILIPYEVKTKEVSFTAEVLLKNFGGPKGILIVSDYDIIKPFRDQVIKLGYGFSTLTEPEKDWPFTGEEKEAFIEMLSDWSWTGKADDESEWLVPIEEED